MKIPAPAILLVLLAGCAAPEPVLEAAIEPSPPIEMEGTIFLPPTQGSDRVETIVEIPVETDGTAIRASVHLGSRYAGTDVPPAMTDVLVELRDPAGEVLAEGSLAMGAEDADLEGVSSAGVAALVFLSYGGSDEQANGDFVRYAIALVR